MSGLSIAAYFPFRRIKIFEQQVSPEATEAQIQVRPDKRFHPVCHKCGQKASGVHCWTKRKVRDLNMAAAAVWITCWYRKIFCPHCQAIHIEDLEVLHPYLRVTTRFAQYIYGLCQLMTITDVARHVGLNWKTIKEIDKHYLERDFGQPDYTDLRILAVDEIAIHKGHKYLTVVLDYISGRVVYVGKDRRAKTLKRFFNKLSIGQRKRIEAVAMDMWDPFIRAVKDKLPNAKIVFDQFHVISSYGKVIDKVRNREYRKASEQDKSVFKGAKYLLLKNQKNVRRQDQRRQLKKLLSLNRVISSVYILKDDLKHLWSYRSRAWATKAIDQWCAMARAVGHKAVTAFAKTLERYRYGILNHCDFAIHTSKIEGVNNKIKVIKRKAYGFHDVRYFSLKIYQAFSN